MSTAAMSVSDHALIVAGVGFASKASAAQITAAVLAALQPHNLIPSRLHCLATCADKRSAEALLAASRDLDVRLVFIAQSELANMSRHCLTQSQISQRQTGIASVSEAAALATGGSGAQLLAPRLCLGPVTCALAITPSDAARATSQISAAAPLAAPSIKANTSP